MPSLTITRGLPGSGKTTYARAWVAEDPARRARVNRDDIGAQLHGRRFYGQPESRSTERAITVAQHAQIRALLDRGLDVICDDTNLSRRTARDLRRVAALAGAGFAIVDLLGTPLDVVLERNAARAGTAAFVPEDVIRDKAAKHAGRNAYEVPLREEDGDADTTSPPYEPPADAPRAVMVDIDGTVALMAGRSPYDETRVHEDRANVAVIAAVRAMHAAGHAVLFCSGRTNACREDTAKWLAEHVAVPYEALHMRQAGDMRKDSVVKLEIFDREIRDRWNVIAVFDDRRQVVDAWRSVGLTVFQVAPGDF